MWAWTSPSPKGTSVMIWFIRTTCAGAGVSAACCSRMALAASTHSSVRNMYFAIGLPLCSASARTVGASRGS